MTNQLEMLLILNALCWSSRKCNCTCALPAEVQLRLRVTYRSRQKLFAGKNFIKILVTVQTQLRSYSEQQRAFGNNNICNSTGPDFWCLSNDCSPPVSFCIREIKISVCCITLLCHISLTRLNAQISLLGVYMSDTCDIVTQPFLSSDILTQSLLKSDRHLKKYC